ncbi:hypothetical protein H310_08041 [Aphanomyces invadans]|uniref:Uncharacterized protein n=1 Tax=Aphanomyces invadans TaxID=157072 RepID=A0A024TZ97_9STRA|nr:hypothetical protein H310_08041 [Aphanomyces invadans]ETV99309.1 hypothetical protein H310_08041 [Aphanomyces invadans]|eukprot:XP_008871865.1 hypothetical protein H310_08041 [Aphanomyces invadans]
MTYHAHPTMEPQSPPDFITRLDGPHHRVLTRRILQHASIRVTDSDDCFRSIVADEVDMAFPTTPTRNTKRPRDDPPPLRPRHSIRLSPRRADPVASSCGLFWDQFTDDPSSSDVAMSLKAHEEAWQALQRRQQQG